MLKNVEAQNYIHDDLDDKDIAFLYFWPIHASKSSVLEWKTKNHYSIWKGGLAVSVAKALMLMALATNTTHVLIMLGNLCHVLSMQKKILTYEFEMFSHKKRKLSYAFSFQNGCCYSRLVKRTEKLRNSQKLPRKITLVC